MTYYSNHKWGNNYHPKIAIYDNYVMKDEFLLRGNKKDNKPDAPTVSNQLSRNIQSIIILFSRVISTPSIIQFLL